MDRRRDVFALPGSMNDDQPPPGSEQDFDPLLDEDAARRRVATLRVEHQDLDASVEALASRAVVDQIQIARLKKKKLALRDEIARLEDAITPDIIA